MYQWPLKTGFFPEFLLWILIGCVSSSLNFAEGSPNARLPKVESDTDTVLVHRLLQQSIAFRNSNADSSIIYADSALAVSGEINYRLGMGKGLLEKGLSLRVKKEHENSIKSLQQSLNYFQGSVNYVEIATAFRFIGLNYINRGEYEKAIPIIHKAIDIIKKSPLAVNPKSKSRFNYLLNQCHYSLWTVYYYQRRIREGMEILRMMDEINFRLDTPDVNMYNNWAVSYIMLGKTDSAVYYFSEGLKLAKAQNRTDLLVLFHNNLGDVFLKSGDYTKSQHHYRATINIGEANEHFRIMAFSFRGIAEIHSLRSEFDSALFYLYNALELMEIHAINDEIIPILIDIGRMYNSKGNYDEAESYLNRAMKKADRFRNEINRATALTEYSTILISRSEYQAALDTLVTACRILDSHGERLPVSRCKLKLANLLFQNFLVQQSDPGVNQQISLYFKSPALLADSIEHLYLNTYNENMTESYLLEASACMAGLGELMLYKEKYRSAVDFLKQATFLAESIHVEKSRYEYYRLLSRAYEKTGDLNKALMNFRIYSTLKDSSVNESALRNYKKIEAQFEATAKDNQIELLQRDNHINEINIRKTKFQRNAMYGGAFMLVIIGVLIFGRYRVIQQQRIIDERARLSADLHDDIGSTLSSISMYSSFAGKLMDENKIDEVRPILAEISQSATQMGEDMNDIIWATNPQNDSFGNLLDRLRNYAVRMSESRSININFETKSIISEIPVDMRIRRELYLICKEVINNSIKHSECRCLNICFQLVDKQLLIAINDDGKGFEALNGSEGNGLKNTRYRAHLLNASYSLESNPGSGTAFGLQLQIA